MYCSFSIQSTESSVLHLAAAVGHDALVKLLVAEGAPVAEENKVTVYKPYI